MTKERSQIICQTTLSQIGGRKFQVMTGARSFADDGRGVLSFRLPGRSKPRINYVQIALTEMDDYTMTFLDIRGDKCRTVATKTGVYAQTLQTTFTAVTGLDTHL